MERAVKHWNRLPRVEVKAPSLEGFNRAVDAVLRDTVCGGFGSAGGKVGLDLFQPKQFHNSVSMNAVLDKDDLWNSKHQSH